MSVSHDEVVNKINSRLSNLECELKAWQGITFNFKKDGTPFQHLSKCFNNARYGFDAYDTEHKSPRLRVSWQCNGYQFAQFDCYRWSGHYNDVKEFLTFDEIKARIEEQITDTQKRIEECKDALKTVNDDLKAIDDEISKLKEIIGARKEDTFYNYAYTLNEYLSANVRYLHF